MSPTEKRIIDILAVRHRVDRVVIEYICRQPFIFAANLIRDDSDERDVMIANFGKFKLKKIFKGKKMDMAEKARKKEEERREKSRMRYILKKEEKQQ